LQPAALRCNLRRCVATCGVALQVFRFVISKQASEEQQSAKKDKIKVKDLDPHKHEKGEQVPPRR
jgi:hypothetical protein